MEMRGDFQIEQKAYSIFIKKHNGKVEVFLFEKSERSKFMEPIPIKISTSTYKDVIEHWSIRLQRYLAKQRRKKNS